MISVTESPRTRAASTVAGPWFEMVDEVGWEELAANGGFGRRDRPLLVKGAVCNWPAWERWSFEALADLRRDDGSEVVTRFITGVTEQGTTGNQPDLPIAPYLRALAEALARAAHAGIDDLGLLSARRRRALRPGECFRLDWSYMKRFRPDDLYLQLWNMLREFPRLKKDFDIRSLWPGLRWTWEYVFIGPAHTVTGFHTDFPNNWFCQVRGSKEVLLVSPEQTPNMSVSNKYDWGATVSRIDITRLDEQPADELERFERVRGVYARVEAGDALFIPKHTWHAVVALEPSISLAVFGLTPLEILVGGGRATIEDVLHHLRLYRWGYCTCHRLDRPARQFADRDAAHCS